MASSDSMSSISSMLECSICMEEFKEDNSPRTLPCSHVYCTACLIRLARDHRGVITCPDCRKEHSVEVKELSKCLTTIKLLEMKNTQRKKREADLQKQRSDRSDSASSVKGQAQSAAQTSGTDIEGLTKLMASMWKTTQSAKNIETAINETQGRQETLLHTIETAKQTVKDRMDQVLKAATERKQQLLQCLDSSLQENLSQLRDIEANFKVRQTAHAKFCSQMAEREAALRRNAQADSEQIEKLIKEILDGDSNFHDFTSIPFNQPSLDTDDDRYQSILTDVSSWGGIKTEHITHEVPPVHPWTQPKLAAMTQHYLAKTEAVRTFKIEWPSGVAQLANGDIAVGSSISNLIHLYDSDFQIKGDILLPTNVIMDNPKGMCATPNGKLCISVAALSTVYVSTPDGTLESTFKTGLPPLEEDFFPAGLASNKEGEVFVSDVPNHVVRVFDQSGQECRRFGSRGVEPGKLCNPWDVAVTPDGKVAVADAGNHRIQVFDGATGRYLATFGSRGSGPNQLDDPRGIAIDSMGFVAVAEAGNNRVQLFTPSWKSFHILEPQKHSFTHLRHITITKRNEIVVGDILGGKLRIF